MTILPQLEKDLYEAARQRLSGVDDPVAEPGRHDHATVVPAAGWPRFRGRPRSGTAVVPVLASIIVVLVIAAVALTSLRPHRGSTPAGAGIAAKNGQIAFVNGRSLEIANPDGSGLRDVGAVPDGCDGTVYDRGAVCFAWSPNGKQLAYLAGGSHKLTLYLLGADGQHPQPLTACGDCQEVSWSPDGSQIAVGRNVAGQVNVWVVNAETGAMRQITDCPTTSRCGAAVSLFQLQWSPDGQEIVFSRFPGGSLGMVRPDGSDLTELKIPDPGLAQWSPDGHELAVIAANGVYIVDAAGTVRELAKLPDPQGIAWSPDGRELAVASATTGVYTVHADGKALTHLDAGAISFGPACAWSRDGKELAYGGLTAQYREAIWTINADGSDRRLIYQGIPLRGASLPTGPVWLPDGRQLAFSSNAGTYVANADGTHLHRIGKGSGGAIAWQPIPSPR
jgi:Tol biopolymer transport system component